MRSFGGIVLFVLVTVGILALLRVRWAMDFWRRARVFAWLYVALIVVLAGIYAYRFWFE
jgi:hypothetical protein